jgi:hypothetical protein
MAEETTMSVIATPNPAPGAFSRRKTPAPGEKTLSLLKRASEGDQNCLPEVLGLLADGERGQVYRLAYGSSAEWLRRSMVEKSTGTNVLHREAIVQELDRVKAELAGPNPTPMESLLAERASLCWFIVHSYENAYINSKGWNIAQADLQHRKIDKAHRRFLTAVRTLAQVRKLTLQNVQLNIARNQVNVSGAGS